MNKEERVLYDRSRNLAARLEMIILLGKKCVSCGFSDWRALQVDHVNGDGHIDRKTRGSETLLKQIQDDLRDKTGKFQLLCANCNQIKKFVNQEYR